MIDDSVLALEIALKMDDYGDEPSWSRRFNIGPYLGQWEGGEILMIGERGGPLVLYSLLAQHSVWELPIAAGKLLFQGFRYMQSLFPLSMLAVE